MWRDVSILAAILALALAAGAVTAQEPSGLEAAAALENVLSQTIATAEKSVVAIARVRKEQPGESVRREFRPDPFGWQLPPTDPNFVPNDYGAGVIVDRRGLFLTAAHVLGDESDRYYITTADRGVYRATIKAADPRSDLAVLGIDGADAASANLTAVRLGDAASLRKGQIILTLGNPHAIARDGQASAGWGIISNLGRKAPVPRDEAELGAQPLLQRYGGLIQTDARLHLGSSGGPLLNLKGEMVGLCISTAAVSGYETPAGYAIPVDTMFRHVLELLKQGREAEYGLLGIKPSNLTPEEIAAGRRGIHPRQIYPTTPAARSGLRGDDIIASVNDRPIYDSDRYHLEIGRLPAEAVVRLGIVRGGQWQAKEIVLSKCNVSGRKVVTNPPDAWRGLRVDYATAYLDADQPLQFATSGEAVVVSDVEANSPAAASGLKRGMLISQVEGRPVRTPRDFRAAIESRSGAVRLTLASGDPTNTVVTILPGI